MLLAAGALRPHAQPVSHLPGTPPAVALASVGLGGLNGLVTDYLWLRASQQQEAGKFWEALQTSRWITALQPRLGSVYEFQAWNLAHNIGDLFDEPRERWRWVELGLDLLHDDGLRANPRDPDLCRALAVLLLDRVAQADGPSGDYARQRFASTPRFARRFEPARVRQLEARYGRLDWRCAASHAFYWAGLGDELGAGQRRYGTLPRWRCAALRAVVTGGNVIERREQGLFFATPRPECLDGLLRVYQEAAGTASAQDRGFAAGRDAAVREVRVLRLAYGEGEPRLPDELRASALELLVPAGAGAAASFQDLYTRSELCRRLGEPVQARGLARLAQLGVAAYNAHGHDRLDAAQLRRRGVAAAEPLLRSH